MCIRAFLGVWQKTRFGCDLKDFDFLHCEIQSTREEEVIECGVVRLHVAASASANEGRAFLSALQLSRTPMRLPNVVALTTLHLMVDCFFCTLGMTSRGGYRVNSSV
jgi:hypothetical protein